MKVNSLKVYCLHIPLISSVSKVFHIVTKCSKYFGEKHARSECRVFPFVSHIRLLWTTSWISIDPSEVVSFTSFLSHLEMLLQLWRRELGAVKWKGSNLSARRGRALDWLINSLPSLAASSKFLANSKGNQEHGAHYSVVLSLMVHIHCGGCGPIPHAMLQKRESEKSSLLG